uniref:Ubiquitin-like domain-containing protein n=1 Tax=Panagrolaimus sp. ES5 TaxID=591445 RepID=A0AC34GPN4_9BILA
MRLIDCLSLGFCSGVVFAYGLGFGNFYHVLFSFFVNIVLYLAWLTTCISPLDYRIWVSQIFSYDTHRLVQVHNVSRPNRRHIFWRSPFTVNSSPHISTLVIVQRPAEVNYPYTRNVPFNFFDEPDTENPDAEQQSQIINYISDTIESQYFENESVDNPVITSLNPPAEDSNRWRALAEIVQQAHFNFKDNTNSNPTNVPLSSTTGQTSFSNNHHHHNTVMSANNEASEEEDVNVKLKHPDDSIKTVKTKLSTIVSTFKNQSFGDDATNTKLIFQGKSLTDEAKSLKFYGFFDECVVHYITEGENSAEETINIRLKHLDDRIIPAQFQPSITVGDFKKSQFAQEIEAGKVIRLIFQGQLLRNDSRTLTSYGIVDQSVIHVHIGQRAYRQEGASQQPSTAQNGTDPVELFANPHLVVTGIAWLDSALLTFLSSILFIVRWAEADDVLEENDHSIPARMCRWLRSFIRLFTSLIAFMIVPQDNDVEMQHQFGTFFNFFVFLKIILIIGISSFFPQVVDMKTIFFISIISGFALLFLWANRPRPRAA